MLVIYFSTFLLLVVYQCRPIDLLIFIVGDVGDLLLSSLSLPPLLSLLLPPLSSLSLLSLLSLPPSSLFPLSSLSLSPLLSLPSPSSLFPLPPLSSLSLLSLPFPSLLSSPSLSLSAETHTLGFLHARGGGACTAAAACPSAIEVEEGRERERGTYLHGQEGRESKKGFYMQFNYCLC
jgi:hypothetical protein